MNTLKVKWVRDHVEGCHALVNVAQGTWDTPWYFTGRTVYRDALGRSGRHAHRSWLVFGCNLTECDAEILVYEDSVLTQLPNTRTV